jgi:hypothetical protein
MMLRGRERRAVQVILMLPGLRGRSATGIAVMRVTGWEGVTGRR